ncbi:Fic family protein [Moraxella cuniculi]|nr:Fic family protein [Moraxella cuniculi]
MVFGEPAYLSIEEKAAHLLCFVIKNHSFADGNKRSGTFYL